MRACMRAKSCRKLVPSVMCHRGAAGADAARGEGTARYRGSARFRGRLARSALPPFHPPFPVSVCRRRRFAAVEVPSFHSRHVHSIPSFRSLFHSDSHSYCIELRARGERENTVTRSGGDMQVPFTGHRGGPPPAEPGRPSFLFFFFMYSPVAGSGTPSNLGGKHGREGHGQNMSTEAGRGWWPPCA